MVYVGPILFGFILGFILGSRIKSNAESKVRFPISTYLVVLLVALFMAWQLGPFPYYVDSVIASGFLATIIGLLTGKTVWGIKNHGI